MTKKDAYYFSHDANAQDDHKCMVLIDQLGMEGYGIFWALIEKLRSEKEYKLPLAVCPSFAKRWGTSKEKIETVIKNYSLFTIDINDDFFSIRLKSSMELRSDKARKSANYRWENANALQPHANALQPHATAMRIDAIKGKESKVKESKEDKGKKPLKIKFEDSDIYDKFKFKESFPEWDKDKLAHYYDAAVRYSVEGNKYVSWKLALLTWEKKDAQEKKPKPTVNWRGEAV